MRARFIAPILGIALLAAVGASGSPQERDGFASQFRPFAEKHCLSCHGPEVQKRKLRLDQLPLSFGEKDVAATWVRVLDRLTGGEMPPKGEARPPEKEAKAVIAGLERELHQASLAKQRVDGRVVLRRLNRIEYETTLRDLLAAPVEVKDLLPDDNVAAGFDKVSAALEISSSHLLRYQEAADKALRSVIPDRPQASIRERRTGREITEKMVHWKEMLGKTARLEGDTLLMYVRPWDYIPCSTAPTPQAGRYRVRAMVQARGTGGKPIPMMCVCRDMYGREDTDVRAVRDVPADQPAVIEGEYELKQREIIVLAGWSLPAARAFPPLPKGKTLEEFAGPALAVKWVEIEGPLDPWPPAGYARLFAGVPLKPKSVAKAEAEGRPVPPEPVKRPDQWWIYDPLVVAPAKPREDAERLIRAFLPKAFRRPVPEELARYYVQRVHAGLEKGMSFPDAMILGYQAALCSPHFLFLSERPGPLDDYAVASRLSYFLWSSMPDGELLERAAQGGLSKPEALRTQVERLLGDPKAARFTANFAGQWLDLRSINATSPDPEIYGEFDDFLFWSMPRETQMYFEEVLRADLGLTDFVHSDWTFLNQRLAQHYGIPGIQGGELRRTKLPPGSHRGGVLTHASILKVTADGTRTSPVLRGKWVLDRILGQPPSPPPPDVPTLEPDIRGATTIRQQLDKHRNTPACASCHRHIDPPGFALESFDVIGGWREFYRGTGRTRTVELANYPGRTIFRGLDVEAGGLAPDGRPFKDVDQYKQLLLADKDLLARNVAQKLLVYATGADIQFADREVVRELVARSRAKNYAFRSLLHEVVASRIFLAK
jgi:mono/diheme cytochrome c family protein